MDPITLRFPPDLLAELDDEAAARGFSSRSEYIRHLLRNRPATGPATGGDTGSPPDRIRERLDALERRVGELERGRGRDTVPVEDVATEDAPGGGTDTAPVEPGERPAEPSDADTEATAAESEPDTEPRSPDDVEAPPDDLAEQVRAYLEAENLPPMTAHGRGAVVDVFRALREHGTLPTAKLQKRVYPGYEDNWAGARGMWNAIDRYLEDVPGVEKGGYGEWKYTGDDAVRESLDR